ncbi:hypothetical protein GALMADRAFT_1264506 [Galerina marginata CBS 339.88]|uniref:Uncharacterized protein n=1 Tax=Galerina marginata (strain CBS 339.88) TaxID=685588 RepID=A0A067TIA7_GALM3|nr:hypothetical protein GALMADRAFT_1264506 [Galerina marginata CBS 339.88]
MRYPEIKSRTTTPKKEPGTIKEEPMAPRKQKKPDVTEEECKSPYEEPFATKLEDEDDTESSDSDSNTQEEDQDSWTVIVYKGVVNKGKPPVEDRRFVVFSDSPRTYIRVEELEARLLGGYQARYLNDWNLEKKGRKPFNIWKMSGTYKRIAIPSLTFKKGEEEQYAYWKEVAKAASRTKTNYDPASRYWDLREPKPIRRRDIELRFEASDKVSQEELEVMVSVALGQCRCQPTWEAVESGEGIKPGENEKDPWVLIDKHLLGLYALYASPETVKVLQQEAGLWLKNRHFPNPEQAVEADKLLFPKTDSNTPSAKAKETGASLSSHKTHAVVGMSRGKTQVSVMNNTSATLLAQIFGWPANTDNKWTNQAEWLHRCAFSYGGLGESLNHLTSQTPDNLIFGTREANTLMMRYR